MPDVRPAPKPRSDPQFANTLERGLRVLQCFSANAPDLGNRDIAEMTGLPRPTVSRLTHTLVELGYLRRRPDSARFEVGNGVLCLGYPVLARLAFRRVAMPHMRHLALEIEGTVSVAVRDRLRMVSLETFTKRDVLRRQPATGVTIDLVGTATGLGWLVGASTGERERALRELAHSAPESLDAVRADYEEGLRQLAHHGYVYRRAIVRPDTTAIATPLRRRPGDELLVLICALSTPAAQAEALERRAGELLLDASRRISAELLAG
ncbi:IclR family transcriptional regulator [Variovorax dokdonensis]|uniref:IclR family transcriptional regulator n=1 Tax=Variovorax dokdonensis TaxID=344883 RepID=A0ABT7NGQ7_9BURK|nr:IclR family transcriptional regulator [Variovorax dokdonensis]MDM0047106.1 IclR family transcriptional regulator [Variovorax dokdonensis]